MNLCTYNFRPTVIILNLTKLCVTINYFCYSLNLIIN